MQPFARRCCLGTARAAAAALVVLLSGVPFYSANSVPLNLFGSGTADILPNDIEPQGGEGNVRIKLQIKFQVVENANSWGSKTKRSLGSLVVKDPPSELVT